jgi:hypothetical protein
VFLFPSYILMIAFPKLLLLWTAFFMLVMWLPMLFAPKTFRLVAERMLKNTDFVRIRAFITLLIWFLFLSVYQTFTNGWAMFFSIFGYVSLIKWTVLMRFPHVGYSKYKWFYSTSTWSLLASLLIVLFSLFTLRVALIKI